MKPTFKGGELRNPILIRYEDLKPGDIVLTYWGNRWHPHRLVSKFLGRWTTKGDNNLYEDPHKMTQENYGGVIKP